jgi:hypothetical protein
MTVNDRWSLVSTHNFCELCLKHFKSNAFPCKLEKAAGGPPPCGEGGCTQFHHPDLHVQRAGWAGVHGAVFTIAKGDDEELDLLAPDDFSRESVDGEIKQGTGDLHACGPSTFLSVDFFIKYGEAVPMRDTLCDSVNAIAVNEIDQIENVKIKENVHANANSNEKKSVEIEIDLENKMIKSSTTNESIAAEHDFIINTEPLDTVNPIDVAEPVDTGDSDAKIDSLDQNVINLCQTISCNDTTLNIGYDSGATVTLVSKKVAEMNIERKETKYILDTVGEGKA